MQRRHIKERLPSAHNEQVNEEYTVYLSRLNRTYLKQDQDQDQGEDQDQEPRLCTLELHISRQSVQGVYVDERIA